MTSDSTCCWALDFFWTDDGGSQADYDLLTLGFNGGRLGVDVNGIAVGSFSFEAVAGRPVSFDISGNGPSQPAFELILVIEQVM